MPAFFFAYDNGGTAHFIPGCVDALGGEHQQRKGAIDDALGIADALFDGILAVDQRRRQLGGVDQAFAHLQKVGGTHRKGLLDQFVDVVDPPHGGDGEVAQVGTDDERLGLIVGNTADAQVPLHFV